MTRESNLILDGTKLPWHLDRVKSWLNGERIAPITVEFSLTRKCTYGCKYCNYDYQTIHRTDEKEQTKEAIFKFFDDAAELGVKAVPIGCDGESTCNPILYDIIPYAKKKGLDTAMSTNGYLLRDDKLEDILPHLTYLRFNISAGEPPRYAEIMGTNEKAFHKVCKTIERCSEIKRKQGLDVTLGMQMVCMPEFEDQVLPLTKLGKRLGVDYLVIKHCSDNHRRSLGIDYSQYEKLEPLFKKAEDYSDEDYLVKIKWSKILSKGKKKYTKCFGPLFLSQISGSGLFAPCGTFFLKQYKKFHIGNILDTRFKDILRSDKYWEVMNHLSSEGFDNSKCWSLCFQHKLNEFLWDLKQGNTTLDEVVKNRRKTPPQHLNFV